jgi:nicotinate-nucleotide--dimethylbenzimidazole phosphoribosyltransferase
MMAVEPGIDILAPAIMAHARPAAKRILDNLANEPNSLDLLCRYGAPDLAAGMGAIVAARMAGCPVVIDDISMLAVAAILARLANGAADHCAVIGKNNQLVSIAKQLNLPMIDPVMVARLGPGENTVSAIPIWRVMTAMLAD